MAKFDSNQIKDLLLQKMYPVYVIDEDTKIIVFANEAAELMAKRPIVGENYFDTFFGGETAAAPAPKRRQAGERYEWEYFALEQSKMYKICTLWFDEGENHYRAEIATDVSDMLGLNRSVVDYLWLMQQLSELQIKIIRDKKNTLPLLLNFLKEHYSAEKIIISYEENSKPKTVICDSSGINQIREVYSGDGKRAEIHVLGTEFMLWAEGIGDTEAWKNDSGFINNVVAIYIENFMLWRQVEWENTHDKATKLLNRACFQKNSVETYEKLEQIGVVFLDIDNLKHVNDEWGHDMGDRLINKAADVLLSVSGEKTEAYRMGGDEFMLICSNFDSAELDALMDEVSQKMDTSNEIIKMPQISISKGYVHSKAPFDMEELIKIADERMYTQKRKKKGTK